MISITPEPASVLFDNALPIICNGLSVVTSGATIAKPGVPLVIHTSPLLTVPITLHGTLPRNATATPVVPRKGGWPVTR